MIVEGQFYDSSVRIGAVARPPPNLKEDENEEKNDQMAAGGACAAPGSVQPGESVGRAALWGRHGGQRLLGRFSAGGFIRRRHGDV